MEDMLQTLCDVCGDEWNLDQLIERGPNQLICPKCAKRLEFDDNHGTLEA